MQTGGGAATRRRCCRSPAIQKSRVSKGREDQCDHRQNHPVSSCHVTISRQRGWPMPRSRYNRRWRSAGMLRFTFAQSRKTSAIMLVAGGRMTRMLFNSSTFTLALHRSHPVEVSMQVVPICQKPPRRRLQLPLLSGLGRRFPPHPRISLEGQQASDCRVRWVFAWPCKPRVKRISFNMLTCISYFSSIHPDDRSFNLGWGTVR